MTGLQVSIATCAILFWIVSVDRNVSDFMILILKLIRVNIQKLKWMIIYHPKNPITNWIMARKYSKIAETLMKEYEETNRG